MNLKYYATRRTLSVLSIPLLILAIVGASVYGLLSASQQITFQAQMVTVDIGVYWDITCTEIVEHIDIGELNPGQSRSIEVFVKNTGGGPITGSFNCSNWVPPEAENYITLNWDFGSEPLSPGRVRRTHFTLTVASDIHDITQFYFLCTVTGTQYIP